MAETYNFKKVTVNIDGNIVTGFMDGTGISIEKNEDDVTQHVGADGGVTWSESNDNTGLMTVTLKQVSPTLAVLRALAAEKREFPISVIDNNGGKVRFTSTQCRVQKQPGGEWADEVGGVEVPILIADYNPKNG